MLKKVRHIKNNWLPSYFAEDVSNIDFEYLESRGVEVMMFDLDHTILTHGSYEVDAAIADTLRRSGMRVFIATNRRESSGLDDVKAAIGAEGIMFAQSTLVAKPSREYYRLAAEMTGLEASEVAMVGDRLIQDIWGANRVGLMTIMVKKFGEIRWYDQVLTVFDRLIPMLLSGNYEDLKVLKRS